MLTEQKNKWDDMEADIRSEAVRKFPGDKPTQDRYVYGAMRARGWKPGMGSKDSKELNQLPDEYE